jgi:hypothetical protein
MLYVTSLSTEIKAQEETWGINLLLKPEEEKDLEVVNGSRNSTEKRNYKLMKQKKH